MSIGDFTAILPLLILAGTAVVVMLGVAVHRNHSATALLSLIGLAAAFCSLWAAGAHARPVGPLLVIDRYALFYMGMIIAATMAFVLFAYDYFRKREGQHDEIYILALVATLGSAVLAASSHLVSLFLGLELLSVSLYGMIAYLKARAVAIEAGVKYLLLAAVSAAFLLFGIALIYAALGSMELPWISARLAGGFGFDHGLALAGLALLMTGLGFKLAVVPFHLWTPDVYDGAPAPVTAYIATVSKGAIFAVVLRYFYAAHALESTALFTVFFILAFASMVAGNLLALLQNNVKRILAYSSIAHLGYILVAFLAAGAAGPAAVTFYFAAYFVTTWGAFGVVSALSTAEREADTIDDYRGLFWRRPVVAGVFTAMLLSLAGIPLTAGFFAKFYVIAAGASSATWALVITLVTTSAIGLYYYLRIVVALYARSEAPASPQLRLLPRFLLATLTVLLFWLGIFPAPLLRVIRDAVGGLI